MNINRTTAWNIVGELRGKTHPEEVIIVGCHYDGHDISQGANDPLSGMVVVTEMARVLSAYAGDGLARTVRFIAWSNEEVGLFGAYHDAQAARRQSHAPPVCLELGFCWQPRRTKRDSAPPVAGF